MSARRVPRQRFLLSKRLPFRSSQISHHVVAMVVRALFPRLPCFDLISSQSLSTAAQLRTSLLLESKPSSKALENAQVTNSGVWILHNCAKRLSATPPSCIKEYRELTENNWSSFYYDYYISLLTHKFFTFCAVQSVDRYHIFLVHLQFQLSVRIMVLLRDCSLDLQVLSTLNLLWFILISESTGQTIRKTVLSEKTLQKAYSEWLLPLRTLVTGIQAETEKDNSELANDITCALNPVQLVLYRCIELVEDRLKHS